MKKITTIVLSGTAALFLSACGGGGSSSSSTPVEPVSSISDSDTILIAYNFSAELCGTQEYAARQESNGEWINVQSYIADDSVTCATYGREESSLFTTPSRPSGGDNPYTPDYIKEYNDNHPTTHTTTTSTEIDYDVLYGDDVCLTVDASIIETDAGDITCVIGHDMQ